MGDLRATLGLLCAAVLLAACPSQHVAPTPRVPTAPPPVPAQPPVPHSDEAGAMMRAATRLATAGDMVGARSLYTTILTRHAGTLEAIAARLSLAEDALTRDDYARALALVGAPVAASSPAAVAYRRKVVLAEAFEGQQDFNQAADAWSDALTTAAEPDARRRAAEGAARTALLKGDASGAREIVYGHLIAPGAPIEPRLKALVEPTLTPDTVARLYGALPAEEPLRAWVGLRHAHLRCAAADLEGCRDTARWVQARAPDHAQRAEATAILDDVAAWDVVQPQTIGVMLPLSGPYARIGEAAKRAIDLAMSDGALKGLTLVVEDTGGDAAAASAIAKRLILESHVSCLLGPIGKHESAAAVAVSGAYGVPHALLSAWDPPGGRPPSAVRLRTSPVEQAQAVARFAATELDLRRVGILFPRSETGRALMGAFWDEVERLGGEVRGVEAYDADTTDFDATMRALLGATEPGQGQADFDALFIPDDAPTVRRLLPFLKFWGVAIRTRAGRTAPGVQLLGAAGWHHPAVIDRGEGLSENAIFVDAYHHDPDDPQSDAFAVRYYQRYQEKPRTFHAEVYDATRVVARAARAAVGTTQATRRQLLAVLTATRNYAGATGLMSVMGDGALLRKARVLTVHLDEIRPRLAEDEEEAVRDGTLPTAPLEDQ